MHWIIGYTDFGVSTQRRVYTHGMLCSTIKAILRTARLNYVFCISDGVHRLCYQASQAWQDMGIAPCAACGNHAWHTHDCPNA